MPTRLRVRIVRVLETHTHADHVSGHGRLALEHGLPVSVARRRRRGVSARPARRRRRGRGRLDPRSLPAHARAPSGALLLPRRGRPADRRLALRRLRRPPDLAVESREGAEGLFHSLRRLLELPDDVRVFPGHVAGSLCGTGMSTDPSSSIGAERRGNPLLGLATVQAFVDATAHVSSPRPPNMERIVELNRGPFLPARPPLEPVAADEATVLDVRSAEAFAAAHVPGALNVPVKGGGFGTKAGFVLHLDERVALHAGSPEEAELAARRLHAVGFLELAGYLDDPDATEALADVGMDELEALLAADAIDLIDVREADERDAGFIPGSRHVPYRLLRAHGASVADGTPHRDDLRERPARSDRGQRARRRRPRRAPRAAGGILDWQRLGGRTVGFRRGA